MQMRETSRAVDKEPQVNNATYMGDGDFDTVAMIAAERNDIGMFVSSTPTGRRSKFYDCCTNKKMGFNEHYHPSTHNPNWGDTMEAEFRAQLSELGYIHEVLADFGPQETGVFNKDNVDKASTFEMYAYNPLNFFQDKKMKEIGIKPTIFDYRRGDRAHVNPFRCMGVKNLPIAIKVANRLVIYRRGDYIETVSEQRVA